MTHATHTMHENSLAAFDGININARELAVLKVYTKFSVALTDREVAHQLRWHVTSARPRCSGLINKKLIAEAYDINEPGSRSKVRACAITDLGRKYLQEKGNA